MSYPTSQPFSVHPYRYALPQRPPQHTGPPDHSYSQHHLNRVPVKLEESPDLPPAHSVRLHQHHNQQHYEQPQPSHLPVFRFGSSSNSTGSSAPSPVTSTPFNFDMSQHWNPSASASASASAYPYQSAHSVERVHSYGSQLDTHSMTLNDDYDDADADELGELPSSSLGALGISSYANTGAGTGMMSKANEKQVRRRSSKACDQCRKSKCKCERSSPQDPCRNCVMLNTPCTFLGPSRKRGPPKGYIDAIEARLHQTEALIGILLSSKDSRARSVLDDVAEDPLAREIINRVDNSPYGCKGRSRGAEASNANRPRPPPENREGEPPSLHATHPSTEWQDSVIKHLNTVAATRNTLVGGESPIGESNSSDSNGVRFQDTDGGSQNSSGARPDADYDQAPSRRQRRRLDDPEHLGDDRAQGRSPSTTSGRSRSPAAKYGRGGLIPKASSASLADLYSHGQGSRDSPSDMRDDESFVDEDSGSGEDELAIAVGQLSLNEDEQLRYHGKASGLHLLGVKEREDGRHEGGIWRFPKARVWPPLPPSARGQTKIPSDFVARMPDVATQELLLELYFTYVHPALPVVHKQSFMEDYRHSLTLAADSPYSDSQASEAASPISPSARPRRVSTLLLLAMFSIAARYSARVNDGVPPPQEGSMWTAGDTYLEDAKVILDSSYAASRPSTCQALLLMGYREVGIGAMAQAWLYVGMAVRMAQDLGLHKSAEKWSTIGKNLFTAVELQERRRIWYGCVIMDKYLSTYIGRPVAIFERDFDTPLPSLDEPEELELWQNHASPSLQGDDFPQDMAPVTSYAISCFNESAKLSIILSGIIQSIYAIRPSQYRHAEFCKFEKALSKWYLELPDHLTFDTAAPKNPCPAPHILTLHMQYWCTVLLLHRPFIRHLNPESKHGTPSTISSPKEGEARSNTRKNYDMCVQAANHITSIVTVYADHYCSRRAPVYFCYYIFTAAIMHVTALMTYPGDTQARIGLNKCIDALKRIQILWPSAWRALELLQGSKAYQQESAPIVSSGPERVKRVAERSLDERDRVEVPRIQTGDHIYRPAPAHFATPVTSPSQENQSYPAGALPFGTAEPSPSTYLPPFDRWNDAALPQFTGNLSTSVLPQQYSTGLVDDRLPAGMGRNSERSSSRFPQYWNDYSSIGQMETAYGVAVPSLGDMGQHVAAVQGDPHTLYVPDQYNLFSNIATSNPQ